MNVQELLTYVEELAFKTSMLGYDKDEVDIQLDKICDEVEAMMAEKEKEIQTLKNSISAESVQVSPANGDFTEPEDGAESWQKEKLEALQGMQEKELKEQIVKLAKELQNSRDQLLAAQTELEDTKAQLADARESIDNAIARAKLAEEKVKAAEKTVEEKPGNEREQTEEEIVDPQEISISQMKTEVSEAEVPETKDEAYYQYLKNADLLCRQLADIQSRQDSIVEAANAEAKKILDAANTEAGQIMNEAKEKVEQMNQESEGRIREAAAKAKKIRKNSQFRVSQEQKRYDALLEKKNNLIEYFEAITTDIQQLVEKVQLPIHEMSEENEDNIEEMD